MPFGGVAADIVQQTVGVPTFRNNLAIEGENTGDFTEGIETTGTGSEGRVSPRVP